MRLIRSAVSLVIVSVIVLLGSVVYTNSSNPYYQSMDQTADSTPTERAPDIVQFDAYQGYFAYESFKEMLIGTGEVPENASFQIYRNADKMTTYKGGGIWDFRFWVDLPDGTRRVIWNHYMDTPGATDHEWTRVMLPR